MIERKRTPLDNAYEAIEVLREILATPYSRSIHFELDVSVDDVPTVTYTVERYVFKAKDGGKP